MKNMLFMDEKYMYFPNVCGEPKYVCEFYLCETFYVASDFSSSISNELHNNKKKFSQWQKW